MSTRTKSTKSIRPVKPRKPFAFNLLLHDRPLHPELFRRLRTVTVQRPQYAGQVHLLEGGHLVEFESGDVHLTEVLVNGGDETPERGRIEALPCRGERQHEVEIESEINAGLRYMLGTQEEQLPPTLYDATRTEILDYAQKRELLWAEVPAATESAPGDAGGYLGALDIEQRAGELHVQSFHLFDAYQTVIKTQAIIELAGQTRR
jgi:hypothetical protein